MAKTWKGCDLGCAEKMRMTDGTSAFPIALYWMRAIDGSDVAVFQTPREHRHSFFEMHFVLRGEMEYCCGGSNISVPTEHLLLLFPEETHRIVHYSADFLKFSVAFSVLREETLYGALCAKSGQALPLSESMRASLAFCGAEAVKGTVYSAQLICGRMLELLCEIGDIHERRKKREGDVEGDIRLAKAKRFIADNPHTFLGCEEVAAYCYLSVKQLNRIFLRDEKETLLKYIHREKISAAEKLLKEGSGSIQEISDSLGFSSVSYFNAFFRKYVGITPGRYRGEVCR